MLRQIKSRLSLFLLKKLSKYLISSVKFSGESQTSCVRLVKVRIVVTL